MEALKTGYEVYDEHGEIDLKASMAKMAAKLEQRNPGKYASFLRSLHKIQTALTWLLVKHPKTRAEVVRLVYFAMRLIDDLVDGDTPHVFPADQRNDIVQEKKKTMAGINERNKKDLFDVLRDAIVANSEAIGEAEQVIKGVEELMESMAFDARRITYRHSHNGELQRMSAEELGAHFHQLDVTGTIYPTSALFGLEPKLATRLLSPLGYACRTAYTLMDLLEDPKQGLLNISKEDIIQFEITDEDIDGLVKAQSLEELPITVKRWCAHMIAEMEHDFATYENNMKECKNSLTYTNNPVLKEAYHLMLKYLVLPKGYYGDIKRTREMFAPIITAL